MKTEEEIKQTIANLQMAREILQKEIEETKAKIDMYKKLIPHDIYYKDKRCQ